MAQPGETITYTFSGEREDEDISDIDEITVDYIDGAGGEGDVDGGDDGGAGGRVENVVADVSDFDTLYIWVGESGGVGRYFGGSSGSEGGDGAGSSEVSVLDTDRDDSDTEPFIAAAGGGGGAAGGADFISTGGSGGARGGEGLEDAEGNAPPQGGDGGADVGDAGFPGDGAVSGHGSDVPIIDAGATTEGGGAPTDTDGEIRIAYKEGPPEPPENLTAELL